MTVRRIESDPYCEVRSSPRRGSSGGGVGGGVSVSLGKMAILTRHAVEAFPAMDMRCPHVKSSNATTRSMSQPHQQHQQHQQHLHHHHHQQQSQQSQQSQQFYEVESPRMRTLSSSPSPVTKRVSKSATRSSSFDKKGPTWVAATMLQSDLLVEVADMSFHLHKFPLLSRSGRLNRLVFESRDTEKDHIKLDNMPGGPAAFELCIKFCYGIPITLTRTTVAALRCAADYLEMTEHLESHNLVSKTEDFLATEIFTSWSDSIAVLRSCSSLLPWADSLQIVKMCCESLAWKACTDPRGIRWSYSSTSSGDSPSLSPQNSTTLTTNCTNNSNNCTCVVNTMCTCNPKTSTSSILNTPHDWWLPDVADLDLRTFKLVMEAIQAKGMRHDMMGSAVLAYAHRWIPALSADYLHHELPNHSPPKQSKESLESVDPELKKTKNKVTKRDEEHSRLILEGIVPLLPAQKDSVPVSGLLRLLRVAIHLDANSACRKSLESLAGMQLEQATLRDLLIPSYPLRNETFYDVGAVHRCLDHFLVQDHLQTVNLQREGSSGRDKNGDVYDGAHLRMPVGPQTAKMKVAKLMDSFLAEIARDGGLTFGKFQALAEALPEFSRVTDDGLYRAIDTFLKAHPGLSEHERKKLCRMMDCQRLSLEACVHAAQNERLPLRIVVQVLFSEQLKLRNAISGSPLARAERAIDIPQQQQQQQPQQQQQQQQHGARPAQMPVPDGVGSQMDIRALQQDVMFMKARFAELQKDYTQVTQQVEKLTRQKGSWVKRLFQSKDNGDSLTSSSPSHPRWSRAWRNSIS